MAWTNEQLLAINSEGQNIIVSAGAGSGKTAVLTQRVITKLKKGVNINELLILTFTNAAAMEMKDRIRVAINNDKSLEKQLDLIDGSYITTFDSFAYSIVKKYHYLLNISNNISILDKTICDTVRKKYLDEIFEEKYAKKDETFLKMIKDLTIKDDSSIKKEILSLIELLDRLIDKENYLDNYINNFYNEKNINDLVDRFYELVNKKIKKINDLFENVASLCEEKYYEKLNCAIRPLLNAKTYDEYKVYSKVSFPSLPKNSDDELKENKDILKNELDSLHSLFIYKDENHLKNTLYLTKDYAISIIDIIKSIDKKVLEYKYQIDEFEFNDIAKMAIKIVSDNEDVRKYLAESFKEIMVDEYQDTSDIQETLITKISHNNVYMVGDIKQSIYRFRNANPFIFKDKYEKYSNHNGGMKIDLLKNFRSRKLVIANINKIFNYLMDENIGGADYKVSHQMVFGNTLYEQNKVENENLDVLMYEKDDKKYSDTEYEAFIIAKDIKEKIKSGYKVLDKETKTLRPCKYSDFCILIDRKNGFETYKKIFEYLELPLVIYYDEKITGEKDILVIKNLIDLIVKIYKKEFDQKFKYDFYSISRSFIYQMSDEEYLNYYVNNNYFESDLFKKCFKIAQKLDNLSNKTLIEKIVNEFDFYEKGITVGNIDKLILRIDYLTSLAENLSSIGKSILDFNEYLNDLVVSNVDITLSSFVNASNSVRLMNIHKSKGLEFAICYFAGFDKSFNKQDVNKMFNFDYNYGLILPFYDDGVGTTILKSLYKDNYLIEDISERIRLFYVALTRAKEKMIMVIPNKEEIINSKEDYYSFLSFINSIKFALKDNIKHIKNVDLTKNYNFTKEKDLFKNDVNSHLVVTEINVKNDITKHSNVSKKVINLLTKNEVLTMEYGTKIHEIFEYENFDEPKNKYVKNLVNKINLTNAKVYKEYEFTDMIDNVEYTGIIDLMIEYEDKILIIDYKLSNINDVNYEKQLSIYKKYIENKTSKNVETYLYSILTDDLKQIETA